MMCNLRYLIKFLSLDAREEAGSIAQMGYKFGYGEFLVSSVAYNMNTMNVFMYTLLTIPTSFFETKSIVITYSHSQT